MNIIYLKRILKVGGIETFVYQLALKYSKLDITIYYKQADPLQLDRLQRYFRCVKYDNQIIECERAFFNYNIDIIDSVIAKEYIGIIHGDYKHFDIDFQHHPKITRYVGVSQLVCDSFTEVSNLPCELCYNPFTPSKVVKKYRFLLAQRFTKEKGERRVLDLISKLDVPFTMDIYTDHSFSVDNENVHFLSPRLDIETLMSPQNYDFFVLLSDHEGYCYGVVESLSHNLPVIVTHLPVFDELGLNESNSIFFEDFTTDKLTKKFNFTFKAPEDNWSNLFINSKSTYKGVVMKKIKAIKPYYDTKLKKSIKVGEVYEVSDERAKFIQEAQFCEILKNAKKTK